jgi:hypothetical protein
MAKTITHGTITVSVPDHLAPPEKAGKMTAEDIARIPKPRRGIGLVCEQAAEAMAKAADKFTPPPGVTADSLRDAGQRADEIDPFLIDIDVVREVLRQSNLIFDADAYEQIRKMNDQVKAQAKHNPELLTIFQNLLDYFARSTSRKAPPAGEPKK